METSVDDSSTYSTLSAVTSLTNQENELIKAVNQRDARLRNDVQHEILSKLLEEIEQLRSIRSSVKAAASQDQPGGELCTCCAQRLSLWSLRGSGEPCPKCSEKTCENCQRELYQHYHRKAAGIAVNDQANPGGIWRTWFGGMFSPNEWLCRYCFKLMQTVVIEYQFGTPDIDDTAGTAAVVGGCRPRRAKGLVALNTDELDSNARQQQQNNFADFTQAERSHLRQVIARDQEFRANIRSDLLTKLEYEVRILLRQRDLARELSSSSVSSPSFKANTKSLFKRTNNSTKNNVSTGLGCLRVLSRFSSTGAGQTCPMCAVRVCLHCQVHVPKMPVANSVDDSGNHLTVYDVNKKRASWINKITSKSPNADRNAATSAMWLCTCCYKMLQMNLLETQFSEKFEHPFPVTGIAGDENDAVVAAVSKMLPVSKSLVNLDAVAFKPRDASGMSDINSDQYSHVARPVQYLPLPAAQHHHHPHHGFAGLGRLHRPHIFGHTKSSPTLTITISSSESSAGEGEGSEFEGNKKSSSTTKTHVHGKLSKKKPRNSLAAGQLSVKRADAVRVHGNSNERRQSLQPIRVDARSKAESLADRGATVSAAHVSHSSTSFGAISATHIHQQNGATTSSSYNALALQQQAVSFSYDTVFDRVPKIIVSELTSAGVAVENIDSIPSPQPKVKSLTAALCQPQSLPSIEQSKNMPAKPARLASGMSVDSMLEETLMFASPSTSPTPSAMSAFKNGASSRAALQTQKSTIGMDGLSVMFAASPAVSMYGTPVGSDVDIEDDGDVEAGRGASTRRGSGDATVKWQSAFSAAALRRNSTSELQLNRGTAAGEKLRKSHQASLAVLNDNELGIPEGNRPVKFYTPTPSYDDEKIDAASQHRRRSNTEGADTIYSEVNAAQKTLAVIASPISSRPTTRVAAALAAHDAVAVKLRYTLLFDNARQQVVFTLISCSNLPFLSTSGRSGVYELATADGADAGKKDGAAAAPHDDGEKQHHGLHRLKTHFGGAHRAGGRAPSPGLHRQGSFLSVMSHTPLADALNTGAFKHTTSTIKHETNPVFNETVHLPRGLIPTMLEAQQRYLLIQIKHREKSSHWITERKWLIGDVCIMLTEHGIGAASKQADEQEVELVLNHGG